MVSVYSSTSGISSANQINRNEQNQSRNGSKLASGSRVNSASDDAASLAISAILASDVSSLKQSSSNLVQGTALLQTADGALEQAGNILGRMKELATQANSGSIDTNSRTAINEEYQNLAGELNNLSQNVNFNGQNLVDGSYNQNFQAGTDPADTVAVDLSSVDLSTTGLGLTAGVGASPTALTTQAGAQATSTELDTALNNLSSYRSQVGALQSGLATRGDVVDTADASAQEARSALVDADIAKAQTDFSNSRFLTDLSVAAAAQGNKLSKAMLNLVR